MMPAMRPLIALSASILTAVAVAAEPVTWKVVSGRARMQAAAFMHDRGEGLDIGGCGQSD